MGCNPWGQKELDKTDRLSMHAFGLLTANEDRKRKKAKCERKGYEEELKVYFILKMINL